MIDAEAYNLPRPPQANVIDYPANPDANTSPTQAHIRHLQPHATSPITTSLTFAQGHTFQGPHLTPTLQVLFVAQSIQ